MTEIPARYAVFGSPIAHSKSPLIHSLFAQQTSQSLTYSAMEVAPENFTATVREFFAAGGAGLNITLPHKEAAWKIANQRSQRAEFAGAVNTLYLNAAGQLSGDNTDGVGLLRDIKQNHGGTVAQKNILFLGAGGAVRGVLAALVEESPRAITIANRNRERAQNLQYYFADRLNITACDYNDLTNQKNHQEYDLIINGTSAGLQGELPPLPDFLIGKNTWTYDMVYGAEDSVFQRWAKERHAIKALNGIGMLVEQAAESFRIWRGVMPQTAPVIMALTGHSA